MSCFVRKGRPRRVLVLGLCAALVVTGVAACSASPYVVSLSVEPRAEGHTLIIAGTTSLPDGARLRYAASSNVATWQRRSGWVTCSGGRFRTGEDVSSWPAGSGRVTVTFDPEAAGQPKDLRKRCGRYGKYLAGNQVVRRGPGKVVEASGEVTLPGPLLVGPTPSSVAPAGDGSGAPGAGPGDSTVYVTRTGEKYHRFGCRYLSRSSIPLSLGEAKARGYTPCSVCRPPP